MLLQDNLYVIGKGVPQYHHRLGQVSSMSQGLCQRILQALLLTLLYSDLQGY